MKKIRERSIIVIINIQIYLKRFDAHSKHRFLMHDPFDFL